MLKINKIILLSSLLLSLLANAADEKRLALVRRIQGLEQLPTSLSRQLQTLTLQVVTKQKDYELLLSGTDTPNASIVEMVALESEVARQGNTYRIEARLLDLKTKKLITRAARDGIREEDLIRLFQGALESLFLPDPEKEKVPKPPVQPKTVMAQPKTVAPKAKVLPPSLQVSQPNPPTLDFKKRVRELQRTADIAIGATVEQKKEDAKKIKPSANTMARLGVIKSEREVPFKKESISREFPQRMVLMAGYDIRDIKSDYYLITNTNAKLLTFKFSGDYPFSFWNGKTAIGYDLAYSRIVSVPMEIPSPYQVGLYASWLGNLWSSSLGIKQEATFFTNLPGPGEGIQAHTITTNWLTLKTELLLDIWGAWRLNASYGVPVGVTTNYKPLSKAKSWNGNNLYLAVTPPFNYKGWGSNIAFNQINLISQGERPFTLNESRIALSIRRSL